ncbi:MerR family transcriptional regulator [Undibacterium sp. CY18W]|uniref:MerR family transcriptional regulator n=1 Tax=Undibacterium hunanense TaxID=2762292 RepID=A0ABR6ZLN1_9BURK|nr:MerR family transcriptional regulator [Undibacterium hunanense]MBC3916320.1 MerR family transcriptional regulator [Undibacterium hunanense]
MLLKIGELASRTGLTIRTLHHYDKIGLLTPSARSEAGYRLYDRADIKRLHRIQALRRLDLSLAEVADVINGENADLQSVIEQQITSLQQQIAQSMGLHDRLQELSTLLKANQEPNLEYWLSTLEMMSVIGKYFSRDEITHMRAQEQDHQGILDGAMRPLIETARALIDQQVPPSDARAMAMSREWIATMGRLMPDAHLLNKFSQMHRNEPSLQSLSGVDDEMLDYITLSSIEVRYAIYRKHLSEEELQYFRASFFRNANAWTQVFSDLRQKMAQGLPPEHPDSQAILVRWRVLFMEAWGQHLPTVIKVRAIHEKEPELGMGGGLTPALLRYAREGMVILDANNTQSKNKNTRKK